MIRFTKMHGLGNDFILTQQTPEDPAAAAIRLCRRAVGVGADGLVLVLPSDKADVQMRIFNADGSEAEMCGNAIRCVARYCADRGLVTGEQMTVETLAGIMKPELQTALDGVRVRVDMGGPVFEPDRIPVKADDPLHFMIPVQNETVAAGAVLMGVPHTVVFADDMREADVQRLGSQITAHPLFPRGTNVNFASRQADGSLYVRTWERGAGRTLACGTGACATAVLACQTGRAADHVQIRVDEGTLDIEVTTGSVFMTGPAAYVFEGETLQ